jgi:hypothetical protein
MTFQLEMLAGPDKVNEFLSILNEKRSKIDSKKLNGLNFNFKFRLEAKFTSFFVNRNKSKIQLFFLL